MGLTRFACLLAILMLASGCTLSGPVPANATGQVTVAPPTNRSADMPSLIEDLKKSVVHVNYTGKYVDDLYGTLQDEEFGFIGSGVVYSIDAEHAFVLTNRHVIDLGYPEDYPKPKEEHIAVRTYDNQTLPVIGRWIAPRGVDLGILEVNKGSSDLRTAAIAGSSPRVGDDVLVIGMPEDFDWSVSKGIVSALRTMKPNGLDFGSDYQAIQTDAAINPGNSGGGMFATDGTLLGINTWKYAGWDDEGLNFAISSADFPAMKGDFLQFPLAGAGQAAGPKPGLPAGVGYLDAYASYGQDGYSNGSINTSFSLVDDNALSTVSDGEATIAIIDDNGTLLYQSGFNLDKADFKSAQGYPSYGRPVATISIPFSDIRKSDAYFANVTLSFDSGGSRFNRTTYLSIPDSLAKTPSADYGTGGGYDYGSDNGYYDYGYPDLKELGISSSAGGVVVTLDRGGMSSGYYQDYTLQTSIKNTGPAKKNIAIKDATLVTGGRQYQADLYDGNLGDVYPDATVDNELVFYDVPSLGGNATLYLELRVIDGDQAKTLDYTMTFNP